MAKALPSKETIEIQEIHTGEIRFNILGESPMIMHRFSQKAWQELLLPARKENRAALEGKLKHDPLAEFRGALYRNRDIEKSLFHIPNGSFKKAIGAAALDMPGAARTKIERLTNVVDVNINLFGTPELFFSMVRNSDMNHTPDVRSRPIFGRWACSITVSYVKGILTERAVANLLGAAGQIVGIGDWRPQKGGPYGKFRLVGDSDKTFKEIVKNEGVKAQRAAWESPVCFDEDSEELLAWFQAEVKRREMEGHLDSDDDLDLPDDVRTIVEQGGGNGKMAGDFAGLE
jgi:hypothetical protein